jgi:hypothetical protein
MAPVAANLLIGTQPRDSSVLADASAATPRLTHECSIESASRDAETVEGSRLVATMSGRSTVSADFPAV